MHQTYSFSVSYLYLIRRDNVEEVVGSQLLCLAELLQGQSPW